jgi:antirestriction protein ArdC
MGGKPREASPFGPTRSILTCHPAATYWALPPCSSTELFAVCARTCARADAHARAHAYTHAHAHNEINARTHIHTMRACVRARAHTHTHQRHAGIVSTLLAVLQADPDPLVRAAAAAALAHLSG